jgi:hypothetical protein
MAVLLDISASQVSFTKRSQGQNRVLALSFVGRGKHPILAETSLIFSLIFSKKY